jgi:hypothetical protein
MAAIPFVRTPASCFAGLEGEYPFAPHHVRVWPGMLLMHYVDEGPRDADPILLLHGEPSWSFLYRHMIRELVELGHRVVAPDLIGFGKCVLFPQTSRTGAPALKTECVRGVWQVGQADPPGGLHVRAARGVAARVCCAHTAAAGDPVLSGLGRPPGPAPGGG